MEPRTVPDLRDNKSILRIAKEFQFSEVERIEEFIMDFDVQGRIGQKMECVVRGGMCVPFYTREGEVSRLSRDVDLITRSGRAGVQSCMDEIADEDSRLRVELAEPEKPSPVSNLLSYWVHYESVFGNTGRIRVDFIHDMDVDVPVRRIGEVELFKMRLAHQATILTRGALIADKVTTLALGEIGLDEGKYSNIPKHIYDIGTQIRVSDSGDLKQALETFGAFTAFKARKYRHEPPYTVASTLQAITAALGGFVGDNSPLRVRKNHEDRHRSFCGTYLSKKEEYEKSQHLGDVLLTHYFAEIVGKYLKSPSDRDALVENVAGVLRETEEAGELDAREAGEKRRTMLDGLPDGHRILRGTLSAAQLDHTILYLGICRLRGVI